MKIATWNVNSLTVRKQQVLDWLAQSGTDILCLQELKLADEKFPLAELEAAGYRSWFAGQKTYNGVAILARKNLPFDGSDIVFNIPGFEDPQRRMISVTVAGIRIISAYFPNGQAPGADKFAYKMQWLDALYVWLKQELQRYPRLALLGDYNIAPEDRDVHDPAKWIGQNLVSPDERAHFAKLLDLGFVDVFRRFEQPEKAFTWWDYRAFAFRRNAGLRIDHILLSPALVPACASCEIDKTPRTWEQPSDHTPVVIDLELAGEPVNL